MIKKILAIALAILLPASLLIGAQQNILTTDTVKDALYTKVNANFTELYNYLTGTSSPTLLTPTINSFANATHNHSNAAGGGATLTGPSISSPVLSGTVTGTYAFGGTPSMTNPILYGTVTGTYILGGTLSITVENWTEVSSFGTNWAGLGVGYMKDPMGFVHLRGYITATGAGGVNPAMTLPEGYRPQVTHVYPTSLYSGTTYATVIAETGAITSANITTGTVIYLDGIIFQAAP